MLPSFSALAQREPCTPAPASSIVEVSFKKGAKLKDLAAWYQRVTCEALQAPLDAADTPLGLTMEGKIAAARAIEIVRAASASAGYEVRYELRKLILQKAAEPCDAARTRALLARVAAAPSCRLDLGAFGCVDGRVKLEESGGKLKVTQLEEESVLKAIGLREGDELVEDRATLMKRNLDPTLTLDVVRAGTPKTLRCEVTGEPSRFHPVAKLQEALSQTQCSVDPAALVTRGEAVEVDSSKVSDFSPECLMRSARLVPAMREGKAQGLKLYAIRPNTFLALLGLQNGDTVKSVNGRDLTNGEEAMNLFKVLEREKKFTVAIERRGEPKTLTIVVK